MMTNVTMTAAEINDTAELFVMGERDNETPEHEIESKATDRRLAAFLGVDVRISPAACQDVRDAIARIVG